MEPTGFDNVVFTARPVVVVVSEFIREIMGPWPDLRIEFLDPEFREILTGPEAIVACARLIKNGYSLSVNLYGDAHLQTHCHEFVYTLANDECGPAGLYARTRGDIEFQLEGVDEIRSDDPGPVGPYRAIMASPELGELTLVTPGDPKTNNYSAKLLNTLVA